MSSAHMPFSRRELLSVLPAGAAGCFGCLGAARCAAQAGSQPWTEKADMSWEEIFRFTFQRNYIPAMKALAARIGREKLVGMLQEIAGEMAARSMAGVPADKRDFAVWVAGLKSPPPLFRHALVYNIVEETERVFEAHISQCLWARSFREGDAADIGYAAICFPDFAVAGAFNPKLKLHRTKTLMQGHDCCNHRYVFET